MNDITRILSLLQRNDSGSTEELLILMYGELRRIAANKLAHESPGQTLDATALVHEAFLRLMKEEREQPWGDRRQFFAAAAEAMRRVLVDNARRKKGVKRGGEWNRTGVPLPSIESQRPPEEVLSLHEALDQLAEVDELKAELVKLRYFVGLSIEETANVLGISARSVDRHWAFARAWLHRHIRDDLSHP